MIYTLLNSNLNLENIVKIKNLESQNKVENCLYEICSKNYPGKATHQAEDVYKKMIESIENAESYSSIYSIIKYLNPSFDIKKIKNNNFIEDKQEIENKFLTYNEDSLSTFNNIYSRVYNNSWI